MVVAWSVFQMFPCYLVSVKNQTHLNCILCDGAIIITIYIYNLLLCVWSTKGKFLVTFSVLVHISPSCSESGRADLFKLQVGKFTSATEIHQKHIYFLNLNSFNLKHSLKKECVQRNSSSSPTMNISNTRD